MTNLKKSNPRKVSCINKSAEKKSGVKPPGNPFKNSKPKVTRIFSEKTTTITIRKRFFGFLFATVLAFVVGVASSITASKYNDRAFLDGPVNCRERRDETEKIAPNYGQEAR